MDRPPGARSRAPGGPRLRRNPEVVKPFGSLEKDLLQPGKGQEVSVPGLPNIRGTDTTDIGARMANYELDMSRSEFENSRN